MSKDKTKGILKLLLRLLVTVSLLWLVLSRIDFGQLAQNIKVARWQLLIVIWAVALFAFWVRAIQMHLVLKRQNCQVETIKIFGASSVSMLYSLVIPGLLSTGVKWYILKQHTGKGSNVLSGMAYNQAVDIVVKVLLGLVALIVANPGRQWKLPAICGITTAAIIAGSVLMLSRRMGEKMNAAVKCILRPFPKTIRSPAEEILEQIKVFQTTPWSFHLLIGGISLAVSLIGVVIYICAAKAVGMAVPAAALVWQSSAVYILGRLPISIANLGVREFTLIEFLRIYGVKPPAVILMSMIIFSNIILMAGIGAIYQLSWAINKAQKKS